jgi:hypothetical protein
MGLPVAALAVVTSPVVAFMLMTLQGVGNITIDVVSVTTLQRTLPKHLIAGVFGIITSLYISTTLLGALVAPALVSGIGLRGALLVAGAALPCLALPAVPVLRSVEVTARRRAEELAPVVHLLEGMPIFLGLPLPALEQLATAAEEETVGAGTAVVREGEPSDDFYAVVEGVLDVLVRGETGQAAELVNTLGAGDYFGEIGLLEEIPRTATVQTRDECRLVRIDGRLFLDVVNQTPSLSGTLFDGVVGRLAQIRPTYSPRRAAAVAAP